MKDRLKVLIATLVANEDDFMDLCTMLRASVKDHMPTCTADELMMLQSDYKAIELFYIKVNQLAWNIEMGQEEALNIEMGQEDAWNIKMGQEDDK
jgi:hypothetical protein